MRIVRFSPQERVDLPDLSAMSFLPLGEFRRLMRGVILGPGAGSATHDNFVIRGFAAEASAVPDALVTVRLVPSTGGGRPLGFAVGGEDLSSRIDFGQLIGGEDQAGQTEGNAQATLDFTGQPNGTYRLQMRFIYGAGVNDNRAFWDAGTNSEFIAAENTRYLPAYELGIATSPTSLGDDWIPLADVVWAGATISPGDITDVREFLFEGTAGAFDAASQGAAGGMADFSRSSDRAANGLNEVYPALRGIARQIQDIKGPDSSGGFNWYGRPQRPYDPTSLLNAEQTKHLPSVDTVTYTVGDGATTFGDFNGADGLEDALAHLASMGAANMPQHTVIVLKSHNPSGFVWNINTAHTLNSGGGSFNKLTLIGRGGGQLDPGVTRVNVDSVASGTALFLDEGFLELVNIGTNAEPANNVTLFGADGPVRALGCRLIGREADGASSAPVVSCIGDGAEFRDCYIEGRVEIDAPASGGTVTPALFERCFIANGCIGLVASGGGTVDVPIVVRACRVTMSESHGWGLRGAIDLTNSSDCVIEGTSITHHPDRDGVHGRTISSSAPFNFHVRDCSIGVSGTVTHSAGGGANGAAGTGWGVFLQGSSARPAYSHRIEGCRFGGAGGIDAGGVYIENPVGCVVEGCEWFSAGSTAGGSYTGIALVDNAAGGWDGNSSIAQCHFHEWNDARTRAILIDDVSKVGVTGCTILGNGFAGALTGRSASQVALEVTGASAIEGLRVVGNHIGDWEPGTDLNRTIVNAATSLLRALVASNTFEDCGGYPVDLDGADGSNVHGNTVFCGTAGRAVTVAAATYATVNDNVIVMGGSARTGINFGAASNNMCSGNRMHIGTINIASGTVYGAPGGGGARTDLNYLT